MQITDLSTEELIECLNISKQEFTLDDFDRWCITYNIQQGEHLIHKSLMYTLYTFTKRRNKRPYKKTEFYKRLAINLKQDGDYFSCNTSLDAFKRLLVESSGGIDPMLPLGTKNAVIAFKRFIDDVGIKNGEESIRLDKFYKVYLDYVATLNKCKKYTYKMFELCIPKILKTRTTTNNIWVMVDPNYKKEFVNVEETKQQEIEIEVQSVGPSIESEDQMRGDRGSSELCQEVDGEGQGMAKPVL